MKQKDAAANHDGPAQPRGGGRVGTLVRHNLVAIGTAAVLTVYSAGYSRTRDAAQRFAEADQAARRPIAPVMPVGDSAQSTDVPGPPSPATSTTSGADRPVAASMPASAPPYASVRRLVTFPACALARRGGVDAHAAVLRGPGSRAGDVDDAVQPYDGDLVKAHNMISGLAR